MTTAPPDTHHVDGVRWYSLEHFARLSGGSVSNSYKRSLQFEHRRLHLPGCRPHRYLNADQVDQFIATGVLPTVSRRTTENSQSSSGQGDASTLDLAGLFDRLAQERDIANESSEGWRTALGALSAYLRHRAIAARELAEADARVTELLEALGVGVSPPGQ